MLHWEGRMKTGPKWPVNSSQDLLLQNFLYQHFFFKWPYLGNETRFFKRVSAKILVSSRAFIPSFMKVLSPNSFILFQPLSWKKALFRGVRGGPKWAILAQNLWKRMVRNVEFSLMFWACDLREKPVDEEGNSWIVCISGSEACSLHMTMYEIIWNIYIYIKKITCYELRWLRCWKPDNIKERNTSPRSH